MCIVKGYIQLLIPFYNFVLAESVNLEGLGDVNWDEIFSLPKDYWTEDIKETRQFLNDQVGCDLPEVITQQIDQQEERIKSL